MKFIIHCTQGPAYAADILLIGLHLFMPGRVTNQLCYHVRRYSLVIKSSVVKCKRTQRGVERGWFTAVWPAFLKMGWAQIKRSSFLDNEEMLLFSCQGQKYQQVKSLLYYTSYQMLLYLKIMILSFLTLFSSLMGTFQKEGGGVDGLKKSKICFAFFFI